MVIDKTLLANVPLWIGSLDLSKVFDRLNWDSLWENSIPGSCREGFTKTLGFRTLGVGPVFDLLGRKRRSHQ